MYISISSNLFTEHSGTKAKYYVFKNFHCRIIYTRLFKNPE